ncbi:DUF5011 domain-containing protein [Mucilaginibacter terrigena]|uniref:DUF5011 domain-containing protein n=1 Tax=Mucilaginibacter terrigena TaxID=2492395 RepID=A0A4Q5LPS5_9SPHI|nr:immunoglobulin-like domain-containing protein [Mucilaginibacter terrigena]RYU91393.1 DUF5011 domain-containing protein [Mucilaginibacter terrigena]
MKKYISYIALILAGVILVSCHKDKFDYKPGYVGRSKITTYPIITVKGSDYVLVTKGGTYNDPGATAKAGAEDVEVKSSTINVNVAGVYTQTYTATNVDGFSATATRHVVVYDTDAGAAAHDYSGNYARNTNGSVVEVTKIAPGVYSVFNPGGAPGTDLTVIAFNDTGTDFYIPQQNASDGSPTSSSQETSVPAPGGKLAGFNWVIINPTYGPALRIFSKI